MMGFGGNIVTAAFSVVVLVIVIVLLNKYVGGDVVFDFFRSLFSIMGEVMKTLSEAFKSGGIPDVTQFLGK